MVKSYYDFHTHVGGKAWLEAWWGRGEWGAQSPGTMT